MTKTAHNFREPAPAGAARVAARAAAAPELPRPAGATCRTARLSNFDALPDLAARWNAAVERCPNASVFQSFEWNRCWWDAFGGDNELFLVLAFAGARLVGVAPMMIGRSDRFGPRGRAIQFIGSTDHGSDYCDFVVDVDYPEALEALLDEICNAPPGCRAIYLSHFRQHSSHRPRTLEFLRRRAFATGCEMQDAAPVRILGNRLEDRKAANKTSLKRHTRFFQQSGTLRLQRCASAAEVRPWLDAFFEQHRGRRAIAGSASLFDDPAQRRFYSRLADEFAPRGWLRFDIVLFNDEPIAFHFGFEYRGSFIWYKPTFDARLAAKSPGEVLIKFLLEDAIDRGLAEFDFTVGSEPFKYRFANETRHVERIVAFLSPIAGWRHRLARQLRRLGGRTLRRLRCRVPSV